MKNLYIIEMVAKALGATLHPDPRDPDGLPLFMGYTPEKVQATHERCSALIEKYPYDDEKTGAALPPKPAIIAAYGIVIDELWDKVTEDTRIVLAIVLNELIEQMAESQNPMRRVLDSILKGH